VTEQDIDEIARKISIQIMKERSRSGDQKAWTLPEWESYIRGVVAERNYHKRMSDKLAENINMLRDALEAIRTTDDLKIIHNEAIAALSRS
jgi:hypothetical protein